MRVHARESLRRIISRWRVSLLLLSVEYGDYLL